jgi:hypothetical protein
MTVEAGPRATGASKRAAGSGTLPTINKRAYLSFLTYQKYLTQIASCLHQAFGDDDVYGERIVQAVRAAPHFSRVHRRPRGATDEQVCKHLRLSWIKEIQLEHPLGDDTFLTELAQDSPRLAYYSVFHNGTALHLAAGEPERTTHRAFMTAMSQWTEKRELFPAPWSVYCVGGPRTREITARGWPMDIPEPKRIHMLGKLAADDAWNAVFQAIATTRNRNIEERSLEEGSRSKKATPDGKKAAPAGTRRQLAARTPPTTVTDFLWRLRTRSDYDDADAFLSKFANREQAHAFLSSLLLLVHSSLTVFETLISAYAGHDLYRHAVDEFAACVSESCGVALRRRSQAVLALLPSER